MDPFSVLFFAFISQLKSYLSKTEYEHDIPKLETVDEPSISPWALPWLNDDVPFESIREFFPAESIKGMPVTSPQSIRLSLLLEAFQQHTRKMNDMSERNQSLEHMVTDLSARIAYLEAQLSAQKGERQMEEMSGDDGCNGQTEVVDKVESLQRSYCKSEERCKQLVVVTQQWAIECEDKDKVCVCVCVCVYLDCYQCFCHNLTPELIHKMLVCTVVTLQYCYTDLLLCRSFLFWKLKPSN